MNQFTENFVVIDIETTGLDPKCCGILEIGAVDARGRRFYERCSIARGTRVDWAALECNGIDALDLGDGRPAAGVMFHLLDWLRADGYLGRWIMGGKNPQFDYGFLEANWPDPDRIEPLRDVISRRCVDLHSLAYGMALRSGWDMSDDDFSTDDLYRSIGMVPEPMPHNALRGAVHEMEGFRRVLLGSAWATDQSIFEARLAALEREGERLAEEANMWELAAIQRSNKIYGSGCMSDPQEEGSAS